MRTYKVWSTDPSKVMYAATYEGWAAADAWVQATRFKHIKPGVLVHVLNVETNHTSRFVVKGTDSKNYVISPLEYEE